MKYLALALALGLASCARHRATPAPVAEPVHASTPPTEPAGITVQPPRTILDKLTGNTPAPVYYPPGTPFVAGKKSTITVNHVAGSQTNTASTVGKKGTAATGEGATATVVEKAKAPVATSTGDATDQGSAGVASTIDGNNNAPVLTNAPVEALDWKAQLASSLATPVGKVVALVLVLGLGYGVYRLWPVLRRKSSTDTTA